MLEMFVFACQIIGMFVVAAFVLFVAFGIYSCMFATYISVLVTKGFKAANDRIKAEFTGKKEESEVLSA